MSNYALTYKISFRGSLLKAIIYETGTVVWKDLTSNQIYRQQYYNENKIEVVYLFQK